MGAHRVHVLMVSLPYQGHINPMLRFAKQLMSKGLDVTLATTDIARSRFANHSASIKKPNSQNFDNHEVQFEFFADGLDDEIDRDKNLGVLLEEYLPTKGASNLSNLIHELCRQGKKIYCIIINCFVPWVTDIAASHNIPCAIVWVQACAMYAIYYRYHKGTDYFPSLDSPSNAFELPGMPLLKVEDLPTFILPSGPRHFYNVVAATIRSLDKVQWVFGSSFYALEEGIIQSMANLKPIHPIGPLVPSLLLGKPDTIIGAVDLWDSEDSCLSWLDTQPPSSVIYISLGSISVLSQSETEAVASALEATNIRFLWVMKKGDEGWERKAGELPKGFIEKAKDRRHAVSWCPQDKVLMHGAVSCFLTHCGWNSTLETVAAGVPIIAFPDWTDQPTNAKLLVDVFGMGVRMKRGDDGALSKEEVERCILEVTEGPRALEMKTKAKEWKDAARKAAADGGSSDLAIEKFIGEIGAGKSGKNV
ncbi:hypothetical protein Ancab_025950 [Ancistrocladus abbreviatus]